MPWWVGPTYHVFHSTMYFPFMYLCFLSDDGPLGQSNTLYESKQMNHDVQVLCLCGTKLLPTYLNRYRYISCLLGRAHLLFSEHPKVMQLCAVWPWDEYKLSTSQLYCTFKYHREKCQILKSERCKCKKRKPKVNDLVELTKPIWQGDVICVFYQ